uniref:Bromodomain adjacent to zinc finger domain, 2A n=1 Tax=Dicentrarchus labrax TaxID=13489 RepID=A0A8C4P0J5_DICLA
MHIMESNNHFNYDTHSSANSGLKLSSGDSLYTNGSSMSFPQQGKNMNGEMNVNGVTTVLGSSVPGSHPPTAPYPHMSNHHQSSMGYDYLWGGHPQYGPAMGTSPGHGMHQKQPTPGMVQPQSQHHFQGHGQYQLNGGIESSHQPPVAGPPNMPLTGSQYWNRSNPGPQQISYNSHSMYGTYQSQAHPGITPSQHHQQQSLQPPTHQPSQQHLHSHREAVKEVDTSYNGMERASLAQRLPKSDGFQPKPVGPTSDYRQHSEQPSAQHPEMVSPVRESAMNTPPHSVSSQLSASTSPAAVSSSLTKASTPPRVSAAPAVSESPTLVPGPPVVSSPDLEPTPPQISTPAPPPRLSSPPLMMQGLRPEIPPAGSKNLSVGSSSSSPLPASPPKLSTPLASTEGVSRPAAVSSVSSVSESVAHQIKASLPPTASGTPTAISPPALVSTSSFSASAPISSLQQMVQGSRSPLMTSGAQHEKPGPPKLLKATSSVGLLYGRIVTMTSLNCSWRREIRVKKMENRMKGETWYYTPCGRRMKQFPEIIKYLKRHTDSVVTREHFSFSPRMPVGDFYEERESPEGMKWVLLANEEVPSMIMAITGRRGRPPNPDKEKPRRVRGLKGGQARRPGRPPKPKMIDLLSKVDAKLLNRLEAKEALTEEEKEKLAKIKKKMKRKVCTKALAKAQAEAEAAAQAALSAKRAAERRAQAQRRLEERKRQQLIAEELKKPTEDMCLTDHKPLPELSRIPGVVLSGTAFAHCLAVVEFLHGYGKVIGLNVPKDIPSLATLQEGLLGLGDSQGEVQDLLIKLVESALHDPGLPSFYQSVKILGDKLVELELTRSTVSEVLRIFMESHGYDTEVCNTMRTKPFHALSPDTKAAILGFLVEELNSSNIVTSDIDNTLENMATYRKNKWIIEGKLRKLKAVLARRTGRSEEELCFEERRRSARVAEEENLSLEESGLERGNRRCFYTFILLCIKQSSAFGSPQRQAFFRKKLLQSSHSMRATLLGQDRYRRRYLALPHLGGVLVEGPEELLSESEKTFERIVITPSFLGLSFSRPLNSFLRYRVLCLHSLIHSCRFVTIIITVNTFNCAIFSPVWVLNEFSLSIPQPDPLLPSLAPADPLTSATSQDIPPTLPAVAVPVNAPQGPPQLLAAPIPSATPAPTTPARPCRRRRRGSRGSSPARRGARGAAAKRRGRPPNSVFQELEQQYFTQLVVKPIPASMVRGWWWIKDPEELYHTLQALHPRGIREKVLHKHLAKHMESLAEICTKSINDRIFELKVEEKDLLIEALQQPWQVQEKAIETDISALQWVEDLEQRVIAADLHLKPYTIPDPDSTRDDLQYYEHDVDPHDDWIVRTKKEWSGLPRIATHPVDLAVLRLANLERNIERRYLKEPLWNPAEVMRLAPLTPTPGEEHPMDVFSLESEITSRLRTWRQALDRCRSAPQVCLCLLQLEKAIAWERSVTKVTCQVCRKGDNDDCLLLCDGCDRGCHMYCLRPKITQVPEGDWFCPTCVAQVRTRPVILVIYSPIHSFIIRSIYLLPYLLCQGSAAKRRRMTTRNQPDLTFCEIILMEMEAHAEAWPFLEPVNPRLVPGYRRIIKNPMDFLTMRERLLQGGYCSCEEFAADALLVFNNCELFNEDTSEVGMAGHSMRRFFESRWAEFYSNKDK